MHTNRVDYGDIREVLPRYIRDGVKVDCVVTSPPYWGLRDYGVPGQLGLEPSLEAYVADLADVFELVRAVLSDTGTLWLNLGDSYVAQRKGSSGDKSTLSDPDAEKRNHTDTFFVRYSRRSWLRRKNLIGIPWHVAFALQRRGWILRDCIIWNKPNPLPESAKDRCTKAHEYVFMLSKGPRYYYDADAISEARETDSDKPIGGWRHGEGSHDTIDHNRPPEATAVAKFDYRDAKHKPAGPRRNRRSVWTIPTEPYRERHYATFPTGLAAPCVLAGCRPGGIVFDPFMGTGTVAAVAESLGRNWLGCEINEDEYRPLIEKRLADVQRGMAL